MTLPTKQISYHLTRNEGPKGVKRAEDPLSAELDSNLVLIKVKAVTLNYRDLVISDGTYPARISDNVIPCSDASGEVVKIGSAVREFKVGDRVITNFDTSRLYGHSKDQDSCLGAYTDGVLTQYKILPEGGLVKIPKDSHLTHEEAATLVCTGVTAWNCLYGIKDCFIAGQSVLLLGTGGVSITALILAKAAGAITIITSSSDEKLKYVQEKYGVDHVVNYKTHPDWEKEVLKITDGEGVDFIIEGGGSGTIEKSLASVKVGGQVSLIGFLGQAEQTPELLMPILMKSVIIRGVIVGPKQLSEQLVRFVHAKKLPMPVEKVFGFSEEEVQGAYEALKSQTVVGKIAIRVD